MKNKTVLQHYLNELHVYCRLRNIGLPKGIAKALAKRLSPKFFYTKNRKKEEK